ncbi:hypothetical protein D918_08544 [Trichuris suis]|nr:hypothetical protein D918_08544 [Trichuris suis]
MDLCQQKVEQEAQRCFKQSARIGRRNAIANDMSIYDQAMSITILAVELQGMLPFEACRDETPVSGVKRSSFVAVKNR